jgi:hypothetical protein
MQKGGRVATSGYPIVHVGIEWGTHLVGNIARAKVGA